MLSFSYASIPLVHLERVWHIGTLEQNQKRSDSHAGSGLAISLSPASWRRIAGLDGPVVRLEKSGGIFADVHACLRTSALMDSVWTWAQRERYVQWQMLFHVSYFDAEDERWHTIAYTDAGRAKQDYRMYRDNESESKARYTSLWGYAPTERMRHAMMHTTPPLAFVQDFALFLFLEACFWEVDGVWWQDENRPVHLSAPHGAIFRHQISSWNKSREDN